MILSFFFFFLKIDEDIVSVQHVAVGAIIRRTKCVFFVWRCCVSRGPGCGFLSVLPVGAERTCHQTDEGVWSLET